ncbi:DUF6361 family protein [Shewanella frigidimarina]|uniref:Uncharacterized protein n=1 Tax=Shewanella frigidimarina TaxID=56812 RepID=A0A119D0K4_SHEFR|nr:DUF6361 family protein [Shewanella frigidimarina]KVX03070.1 hypothetical protein AWJ07_00370 [Shewanella frigidimarina]
MSQLGWVDFSSDERNKVKLVLAALSEPGTLDELGIGQIRDAFANRLFPGLSTIQTRAKYFIIIARLLRDIQNGKAKKPKNPHLWLEQQEHLLAEALVRIHGGVENGIIGAESIANGGVGRRPSSIYWNGLKTFGIVKSTLSLHEFCTALAKNEHMPYIANSDHQEGKDDDVHLTKRWIELPDQIDNWQADDNLKISLSLKEAEFLKEKISTTPEVEHSVLAQILRNGGLAKLLPISSNETTAVSSLVLNFDALACLLTRHESISERCKQQIIQAQSFSLAMEGPHIRFNILLAQANQFTTLVKTLDTDFQVWLAEVKRLDIFHSKCADNWFSVLTGSRINPSSRTFVECWCKLMAGDAKVEQLDELVKKRAKDNKQSRSLLNKKRDNENWAGIRRLDFRWGVSRKLLADIEGGLNA